MSKYNDNLIVSSSPHLVTALDTQKTMLMVMIALCPSLAVSTYVFGPRVLLLTIVSIAACMFFEWAWNAMLKRRQTVGDLSAALTGMLLAFNVPSGLPIWTLLIGDFAAIIVVKQLFGGIGKNLVNPAITGRIILFISFATEMTDWTLPRMAADATSTATPLGILAEGGGELPSNVHMFLGFVGGSFGEVSAVALLVGGIFLVWKKIISPIIPCCFIGTVFVFALIYYAATGQGDPLQMAIFHILAGGVMLGAIFMATDYVTSPLLPKGKIVFGIGCGIMTMVIRLWGQYPEGVSFSILLMNCVTPLINDFFQKRMYGGKKK
ncbi:MAG: RnfABCDGE type electron transport complex subunit D [Clostridiales bacterium]|nr:RnfABCDGE type electron transport complex subunit D [Clostridiales bacterium]